MTLAGDPSLTVRDAEEADVPTLMVLKGADSEQIHRDRLQEAQDGALRYLVLVHEQQVIGYVCLVFRRPEDTLFMPHIDDLRLAEEHRGQGYGTAFIQELERIAAAAGYHEIYISVEPDDNPRALALYQRLGYQQIQAKPYLNTWDYRTADGQIHQGSDWIVDMVKPL